MPQTAELGVAGQPVTIAAFGGSVTYGVGTQHPQLNGWLVRVVHWVQATFPHPGHKLLNFVSVQAAGSAHLYAAIALQSLTSMDLQAVSAASSPYTAPCVLDLVGQQPVDLAFVEFSFNDGEMSSWHADVDDPRGTRYFADMLQTCTTSLGQSWSCSRPRQPRQLHCACHACICTLHPLVMPEPVCRRGIERIFRKVLGLAGRPAVLYYHYLPARFGLFKTHYNVGVEDRIDVSPGACGPTPPASLPALGTCQPPGQALPKQSGLVRHPISHALAQVVCRYYGITSLSMRGVINADLALSPDLLEQLWYPETISDNIHPTCLGMRCGLLPCCICCCCLQLLSS